MRSIRIHHAGPFSQGARLTLDDRTALHLTRVLRLRAGAPVVIFDGRRSEHEAVLITTRDGRLGLEVGNARMPVPPSPLAITLAQGISRSERMDYAVQKATELGVHAIVPLLCERSVVKLDPDQADRKRTHWFAIATSACEQSGRADLPAILPPGRLDAHLATTSAESGKMLRLVLDPACSTGPATLPSGLKEVELLIGPEGGLTDNELNLARRAGYRSLRLGPRVLRTETAAAAAIAVLQALHGDLG